jgi:hypothetical protein
MISGTKDGSLVDAIAIESLGEKVAGSLWAVPHHIPLSAALAVYKREASCIQR